MIGLFRRKRRPVEVPELRATHNQTLRSGGRGDFPAIHVLVDSHTPGGRVFEIRLPDDYLVKAAKVFDSKRGVTIWGRPK